MTDKKTLDQLMGALDAHAVYLKPLTGDDLMELVSSDALATDGDYIAIHRADGTCVAVIEGEAAAIAEVHNHNMVPHRLH